MVFCSVKHINKKKDTHARGNRDNIWIISHISPQNIFCDPSLELFRRDGFNEGSEQFRFR